MRESGCPSSCSWCATARRRSITCCARARHADDPGWRSPDLILLDLNLPRLTGREVLERIRATPDLRAVPVVVLTTSRRQEDVQDMYAAGANTYIEKPQDFTRFVQVLQTIQRYWLDTALLPAGTVRRHSTPAIGPRFVGQVPIA